MPSVNPFVFTLLTLFAFNTFAETDDINSIEKLNWFKPVTADTVKIDNQLGDIRLRFGGYNNEIEIIAMVQHNESIGFVEITESEKDNTYYLSLRRVNKETGETIELNQNDKTRVDFTVMVPQGIQTYAQTDSGLVEARKMKDPVFLNSQKGDIFLRDNKTVVQASTESGKITGNLLSVESENEQVFKTVTGMIDLWIGERFKQTVHMATSGEIITDFSVEIERDMSKEPNKQAIAKTNGGGSVIKASSKQGSIALRAFPQNKS